MGFTFDIFFLRFKKLNSAAGTTLFEKKKTVHGHDWTVPGDVWRENTVSYPNNLVDLIKKSATSKNFHFPGKKSLYQISGLDFQEKLVGKLLDSFNIDASRTIKIRTDRSSIDNAKNHPDIYSITRLTGYGKNEIDTDTDFLATFIDNRLFSLTPFYKGKFSIILPDLDYRDYVNKLKIFIYSTKKIRLLPTVFI